jgi:hypothetical protein
VASGLRNEAALGDADGPPGGVFMNEASGEQTAAQIQFLPVRLQCPMVCVEWCAIGMVQGHQQPVWDVDQRLVV